MAKLYLNVLISPAFTAAVFVGTVLMCLGAAMLQLPAGGGHRSRPGLPHVRSVMSEKVLAVDGVVKIFEEGRQRVEVLKGVSMEVEPGEVVALEGPSGSGKTTLLSIMGCILSPTSGEVRSRGARAPRGRGGASASVRRRSIGFVFQQYNLFPALTALENVEYALNVKGMQGPERARGGDAGARAGRPRRSAAFPAARPLGRAEAAGGHRAGAGGLAAG